MNEMHVKKMNNELPIWDLSEIYKNIKDPKISRDIKNIKKTANNFLKKWKGKINKSSPSDFLLCINEYQEINEAIYKIATHSSLTFATNMEDPEISKYNSSISDEITEILSTLIFVTLELAKVDDKTINNWLNDKDAKIWKPYLNILRKRNPYLLDPLVEEILIENTLSDKENSFRVKVEEIEFKGSITNILIQLKNGSQFKIQLDNMQKEKAIKKDDEINIYINPKLGNLFINE